MAGTARASLVQCSRMNWAIGQGSIGGECCRRRGKFRFRTRTNSFLHSQKLPSSSRSSSGVKRSEEKIVVGAMETESPCAGWRLRRRGFMASCSPLLLGVSCPRSNGEPASPHPGTGHRPFPPPGAPFYPSKRNGPLLSVCFLLLPHVLFALDS